MLDQESGYVYLGRVIEDVMQEPFATYVDKEILRPLGMARVFHSGGQNGFISYFYVDRASRKAAIVVFNTETTLKAPGETRSTRALDTAMRDAMVTHLFERVRGPGLQPRLTYVRTRRRVRRHAAGGMFWFSRNRLPGSYLALSAASRA